jgi:hypothetical protein
MACVEKAKKETLGLAIIKIKNKKFPFLRDGIKKLNPLQISSLNEIITIDTITIVKEVISQ